MKKKITALTLVCLMLLGVVIPASAATRYTDGYYKDCLFETQDSCTISEYSSMTMNISCDYPIRSDVTTYTFFKYDDETDPVLQKLGTLKGQNAYGISTTSGTSTIVLNSIVCEHYMNNEICQTVSVGAN